MIAFMIIALLVSVFLLNLYRIQNAIEIWLKSISKRHLSSELKLATEKERQLSTKTLENSFSRSGNATGPKSISKERLSSKLKIGDRKREASCYGNLGTVFLSLGRHDKAKGYLEKALVIRT